MDTDLAPALLSPLLVHTKEAVLMHIEAQNADSLGWEDSAAMSMSSMNRRRGPWSQHEDFVLMDLVQRQGALNWVRIAAQLSTRTPKQCRERFHQNLKPTLNHEPISPEEGAEIERLVNEIGKRWAEIARRLHGRSDNAVKNWWNGSQNRRKRMDRRRLTTHACADERADMSPYSRPSVAIPRALPPIPASSRPIPPPILSGPPYSRQYETPLPSPSEFSPDSDAPPSLASDASYYSISPKSYDAPTPASEFHLPPLKIQADDHYSYGSSSLSPPENKLPPLKDLTSPRFAHSPEFHRAEPALRLPPMASQVGMEHLSPKSQAPSQLPTAPNSPVCLSNLRPQEERTTRVPVADLLH